MPEPDMPKKYVRPRASVSSANLIDSLYRSRERIDVASGTRGLGGGHQFSGYPVRNAVVFGKRLHGDQKYQRLGNLRRPVGYRRSRVRQTMRWRA